jgi:2-keto-4-pentenoate hydratase
MWRNGLLDPCLRSALETQLETREAALRGGAVHVGWKLGMGERESIGGRIAVGFLTSATILRSDRYLPPEGVNLHADAEVLLELGADVKASGGREEVVKAISRYGAALELVDLAPREGEPEAIVAGNVFHLAVAIAEREVVPSSGRGVTITVDGEPRGVGSWPGCLPERLVEAAEILEAVGQQFRRGDKVITGSIVQVPVGDGSHVEASFGGGVTIAVSLDPP